MVALLVDEGRVRIGLVMPVLDRVVDVSVQPSSAVLALEEAARRSGVPMSAVERDTRVALAAAATTSGAWQPPREIDLVAAFGGAAFPLLGAAYDRGAAPVRELPRWAEPILARATVREGAIAAFGAAATRPVRRALVEALHPLEDGGIDLGALGVAVMAHDTLEPDRLARVLGAARVRQSSLQWPDRSAARATRQVLGRWGPVRTERVLIEALGRPDGVAVLLQTLEHSRQLGDHGPPDPLPGRLDELHDAHRSLLRSATSAPPRPARRHLPDPVATERSTGPTRRSHRPLGPPVTARAVGPHVSLPVPARLRRIDGYRCGELTLVLPHTAGDLERWGRLLSNCLSDFATAVLAGRSTLVGVQRRNSLVYVVELTPTGAVRQFCARANRRPPEHDRQRVLDALRAVLDDDAVNDDLRRGTRARGPSDGR